MPTESHASRDAEHSLSEGIGSRAFYERYYASRGWSEYQWLLSMVIRDSGPGPILDVGTGTGLLVEAALRWGLQCEGIDGSSAAIELAKQRYPGLTLRQHFLSDPLPFERGSFRTVILNQVLPTLDEELVPAVLKEVHRVLCAGGMILATADSPFSRASRSACPTVQNFFTPTEVSELLLQAGFDRIQAFNEPIEIGRRRFGGFMAKALLKLTGWDRVSATANCIAFKAEL